MNNECRQVRDGVDIDSDSLEHPSYYHATKLYWFFIEQISEYGLVFDVAVKKVNEVLGLAGEYNGSTNDFKELVLEPLLTEISKKTEFVVKCSLMGDGQQAKLHFALKDTGWKKTAVA